MTSRVRKETFKSVVTSMMAGAKGMPQKDIREELKKTLAGILMTLNVLGEKRLEEWMKKELIKFEI